jgi:hypothetical protein
VSKLGALEPLGLALSEKQIPQIVENSKKYGELLEPLEGVRLRPRDRHGFQGLHTFSSIPNIYNNLGNLLFARTLTQMDSIDEV